MIMSFLGGITMVNRKLIVKTNCFEGVVEIDEYHNIVNSTMYEYCGDWEEKKLGQLLKFIKKNYLDFRIGWYE